MDFNLFMDSINGTSIFGGIGISMVNGIKVSAIGWDNNESQLSVILSGKPMDVLGGNNTASTENNTAATITSNSYNSVSVIAKRTPINMLYNIASPLLSSVQIGSSSLTNADWSVPQTVTIELVGSNISQEPQQSYLNKTTTADLLLVSVIPYTGPR